MAKKTKKKSLEPEIIPQSDDFIFGKHPRKKLGLIGHQKTAETILHSFLSERPHQAILLTGKKGIGKATFVYHLIRALERKNAKINNIEEIYDKSEDNVYNKLSSLGMGNIKIIRRSYNNKTRKFYSNIRMDEIRGLKPFFNLASHNDGYRYCVIDCVDDMMHSGGSVPNALLKTLEEPPKKTLFFLIAHHEGNILPTIKSRCQILRMTPPTNQELKHILDELPQFQNITYDQKEKIISEASGSVRNAMILKEPVWQMLSKGIKNSLLKSIPPEKAISTRSIREKFSNNDGVMDVLSVLHMIFLTSINAFTKYNIKNKHNSKNIFYQLDLYDKMHNLFIEANNYNFSLYDTLDTAMHLITYYHYNCYKASA